MRALVLTLAVVAAVAGCGGSSSEQPRALPSVNASPSPASSPSVDPGVPPAAEAATAAGAESFATFFYSQTKRAFETKNPDLIRAISAPGCTSCNNYIQSITRLRDNNERVENFTVNVLFAAAPAVSGTTARVDVAWSSPEVIRYDAAGKVISREGPFKRVDDQMSLVRRGDRWLVAQLKSLRLQK